MYYCMLGNSWTFHIFRLKLQFIIQSILFISVSWFQNTFVCIISPNGCGMAWCQSYRLWGSLWSLWWIFNPNFWIWLVTFLNVQQELPDLKYVYYGTYYNFYGDGHIIQNFLITRDLFVINLIIHLYHFRLFILCIWTLKCINIRTLIGRQRTTKIWK